MARQPEPVHQIQCGRDAVRIISHGSKRSSISSAMKGAARWCARRHRTMLSEPGFVRDVGRRYPLAHAAFDHGEYGFALGRGEARIEEGSVGRAGGAACAATDNRFIPRVVVTVAEEQSASLKRLTA